jgi:hypothetical protein
MYLLCICEFGRTQIFIYVEMFESPPDKSSPECININIIKIVKNTTEI